MLKTDAIIGGVHFFAEDDARDVARKALRVNLSDLAAKGATPLGFLVSLALPRDTSADWLKRFALGLREDAEAYACPLFGGDTDRTPGPVMVSISMFGSVPSGAMVRRAGARPGHRVFVTGTIGDAALGLVLRQGAAWPLTAAQREHLLPAGHTVGCCRIFGLDGHSNRIVSNSDESTMPRNACISPPFK